MKELTRNTIPDLFYVEKIDIPEWEGYVYLRKWTGAERFKVLKEIKKIGDIDNIIGGNANDIDYEELHNVMLIVVCKTLSDSQGVRLYKDDELSLLDNKDPDIIQKLFAEAMKVNGMGEDAVGNAAKNSETSQNG